MDGCELLRIVI